MSKSNRLIIAVLIASAMILSLFSFVYAEDGNATQPISKEMAGPKPDNFHTITIHFHRSQDGMDTNDKFYGNVSESGKYVYYVKDGERALVPERIPVIPHRDYLKQKHIKYFSYFAEMGNTAQPYDFSRTVNRDIDLVAVYENVEQDQLPLNKAGFVLEVQLEKNNGKVCRLEVDARINRTDHEVAEKKDGVAYRYSEIQVIIPGSELKNKIMAEGIADISGVEFVSPELTYDVYGHVDLPYYGESYVKTMDGVDIDINMLAGNVNERVNYELKLVTPHYVKCYGNVYGGLISLKLKDTSPADQGNGNDNGGNDNGGSGNDNGGSDDSNDGGVDYFPPITTPTTTTTTSVVQIEDEDVALGNGSAEDTSEVTTNASTETTDSGTADVNVNTTSVVVNIEEEDAALGSATLPHTGNSPNELYYIMGSFVLLMGVLLKMAKTRK